MIATLLPVQTVVMLYLAFAFLCAIPWIFNWVSPAPITTRLLSLLVFLIVFTSDESLLWTVHNKVPGYTMDVLRLLFPMMLFSVIGIVLVMKSLVKMAKKSMPEGK
jgi:prepilin signal peptidase PulO-like enzyme (type II secretory pathway)